MAGGERQLGVILNDRPQLAAILEDRKELRHWLITELNRKEPARLWDPAEPVSGRAAEHEYPSRGGAAPAGTAVIRVSARASGWDELAALVFELHNLHHSGRFAEIYRAAVRGQIDETEYVQRSLAQEFAALRATRRFLETHVGELPDEAKSSSPLYQQIMATEDTLKAHLEKEEGNGRSLTTHFERLYEREVVPEMRRNDNE
ncbi:MAG TPA: hypothetical protein VE175_09430 [Woeseiaceae bacterium]|nr:hypothetical protein [Woeseiaceae bacterium]